MKVYATEGSLAIKCPACGVEPGVACAGNSFEGPLVHERRIRKAEEMSDSE